MPKETPCQYRTAQTIRNHHIHHHCLLAPSRSMDPSFSTFKTINTNRWGTLSVFSEKDETKNPTIIPSLTQPTRSPIVFGSELVPPKDPVAYSHQVPIVLKMYAQGLHAHRSYRTEAEASITAPAAAATARPALDLSPAITNQTMSDAIVIANIQPNHPSVKRKPRLTT